MRDPGLIASCEILNWLTFVPIAQALSKKFINSIVVKPIGDPAISDLFSTSAFLATAHI